MKNFIISNKAYDALKWIAQILLPAIGTLYFALAEIWHFPLGSEVVGTITAVDAFLGVILGLSSSTFNAYNANKDMLVDEEEKAWLDIVDDEEEKAWLDIVDDEEEI